MLTWTVICQRCGINLTEIDLQYEQFEDLSFYWWELTSEILKCQRYSVNLTNLVLRYEQFWGLVILLMRIDRWSLECQRCSINLTIIYLWLHVEERQAKLVLAGEYWNFPLSEVFDIKLNNDCICGPTTLWKRIGRGFL